MVPGCSACTEIFGIVIGAAEGIRTFFAPEGAESAAFLQELAGKIVRFEATLLTPHARRHGVGLLYDYCLYVCWREPKLYAKADLWQRKEKPRASSASAVWRSASLAVPDSYTARNKPADPPRCMQNANYNHQRTDSASAPLGTRTRDSCDAEDCRSSCPT